jgi:hypothetical protein
MSDTNKMLLAALIQVVVVAAAAYAIASPGGAFVTSTTFGQYGKYIVPLLLGLLAALLCWGVSKMM